MLARFRPLENKPSHLRRCNVVHIITSESDGTLTTLCGRDFHETREIPTDYKTRFCRRCMAAKDAADTRPYREATRRERRIRKVLV